MPTLVRTILWRSVGPTGSEYFGLWRDGDGWQLRGTVVAALDGQPARVRYGVICDAAWRTMAVHVALRTGSGETPLHLTADGEGNWRRSGSEETSVLGCLDIDLAITPATNTLPIRRLNLDAGETRSVTAAWLRFPELTLQPLDQTYERLNGTRYRYTSATGFSADLEVDDLGVVTRYGNLWERAADATFGHIPVDSGDLDT